MLEYYHRKGYSDSWINQRLQSIEIRKELTDEWERRVVKKAGNMPFLTGIITLTAPFVMAVWGCIGIETSSV